MSQQTMHLGIAQALTLPCGLTLPNRLVKAAMTEALGDKDNMPGSQQCLDLYQHWAKGGWGLVITGNVQVDHMHLGDPRDFAINNSRSELSNLAAFKAWAEACCSQNGTKTVVQLSHPGRQVAFNRGDTVAPSAVPMDFGPGFTPWLLNRLIFGTPRALEVEDIEKIVQRFADAASLLARAGFAGVELHAAHGYLLSQFLSPRSNRRTDQYGGDAVGRARIVVEIIRAIRAAVAAVGPQRDGAFCIGVKMNSVDVGSGADMEDSMQQIQVIVAEGIDFLEISGGTFENPTFSTGADVSIPKASTRAREAFFLEFATVVRSRFPQVPLIVTGGFRSRRAMEIALEDGSCDMIGMARPAVVEPSLPRSILLNAGMSERNAVAKAPKIKGSPLAGILGIKLMGVGPERDWYTKRMHSIGQ